MNVRELRGVSKYFGITVTKQTGGGYKNKTDLVGDLIRGDTDNTQLFDQHFNKCAGDRIEDARGWDDVQQENYRTWALSRPHNSIAQRDSRCGEADTQYRTGVVRRSLNPPNENNLLTAADLRRQQQLEQLHGIIDN